MPAFDVVIHVSRWEGQPRVVQESIAERVPVVATRVSGLTGIVVPGQTGYLVEPGDARGLAEKALGVLDRPGLRPPLPQSVVDEVARRNGREAALSGHLGLYEQLLRRPLQH
jgi:glycosyltransferase involved in cell wall biosynthesis